jgi:hypothetical protein
MKQRQQTEHVQPQQVSGNYVVKTMGRCADGCAALLLTACTVVDLDANGKPIMPADPNAKASFDNRPPADRATNLAVTRIDAATTCAGRHCADHTAEGALFHATKRLCPPDKQD